MKAGRTTTRHPGVQVGLTGALLALQCLAVPALAQLYRDRLPQDEVVYFLLPDRFENGDASNDRGGRGTRAGPITATGSPTSPTSTHISGRART